MQPVTEDEEGQARRDRAAEEFLANEGASADQARPKAPAGWYNHPTMADTRRYWDGARWTEHVAPGAVVVSKSPGRGVARARPDKDDTSLAWVLALIPALWLPVDYFVPAVANERPAILIGIAVSTLLIYLDKRRLRERGVESAWLISYLLIPLYLIIRTRRAGSSMAIPIVWFATFGLSLLGTFTFTASYWFDGDVESRNIEHQLSEQGIRGTNVSCPDRAAHDGDTITCTVVDRHGNSSLITVTIDSDNGYVWRIG